jgi:hypothetical protein
LLALLSAGRVVARLAAFALYLEVPVKACICMSIT